MDVVMLAQHGIDTAVAVLGTALTADHLKAAFRVTPRVILCFDGDAAGRRAAERAVDNALPELSDGRDLRLLFLPGEDPDSLVRRIGRDGFLALAGQATPVSRHLLNRLLGQVDLGAPEGRAALAARAKPCWNDYPPASIATCWPTRSAVMSAAPYSPRRVQAHGQSRHAATSSARPSFDAPSCCWPITRNWHRNSTGWQRSNPLNGRGWICCVDWSTPSPACPGRAWTG